MPEWLVERGIGETRFALLQDGEIVEARVEIDGIPRAGSVIAARVVTAAARNAVARDGDKGEYLLPRGAPGVTEGAAINIEITRSAILGSEPWTSAMRRIPLPAPSIAMGSAKQGGTTL